MKILLFCLFVVSLSQFQIGETVCISQGLNLRATPCGNVVRTSTNERGVVEEIQRKECPFGTYTWIKMKIQTAFVWGAFETNLISKCGGRDNNVPMVHQRWDVGPDHDGSWSCSATTMAMILAFFNKLPKRPIQCPRPTPHTNDYGWYIISNYTSVTGITFNRGQLDPKRRMTYGGYGTCTDGGAGWAWRMQRYAEGHGLKTKFFDRATFALIQSEINRGALVALSTDVTPAGHIFVVKGHRGSNDLLVNDPFGNWREPGYGTKMNGANLVYPYNQVKAKWMVTVWV